ncbi:MAG TPA: tetratricopeptide repeat protein [Gammaproteobacteria bacterium]|nr:tetratricopeptide repeat protein [Gammaproteobacteria bacterium]
MQAVTSKLARGALLISFAAYCAACTTLSAPSRPAPTNVPRPPPGAGSPSAPAPAPLPPSTRPPPRSEPLPAPPRGDLPPSRPQSDASGASGALLEQSRAQRAAGSLPAARASLERALRLDPNSPVLWLELGELELQVGNNAQAATLARKAMTLAGRDTRITARAERLLRAAE